MTLPKAVFDPQAKTKNLVTTIAGIVTLVITLLVTFGVITPDQATGLTTQTNVLIEAVPLVVSAIAGIILIFKAKDA
jgi:protein-S-isoprenylcysteine O-methyltransferase Ste14